MRHKKATKNNLVELCISSSSQKSKNIRLNFSPLIDSRIEFKKDRIEFKKDLTRKHYSLVIKIE